MSFRCANCNKEIPVFSEFWLREPAKFDGNGVVIERGKSLPLCRLDGGQFSFITSVGVAW
ncbi:unnamed protein product [marine sediment metagenome]|uniref:Uncharacterized protein n=1 Tax=marine sediment metagenome TaxID=412755 RepID=X1UIQ3_9ZZZZ